ncbi:MAG: YtxH domain-containing protein [Chloroflexi bacterium]|nr:YtxH domain-containing protein [Chloroflexota bacterium]
MNKVKHEHGYLANNVGGFFAGLLLGGLLGAGAMLLLAPQSGEKTRDLIQKGGKDLRDQVTDTVEDVVLPIHNKNRKVMTALGKQAKEIEESGDEAIKEQKEIVIDAVEAEKTAIRHITHS